MAGTVSTILGACYAVVREEEEHILNNARGHEHPSFFEDGDRPRQGKLGNVVSGRGLDRGKRSMWDEWVDFSMVLTGQESPSSAPAPAPVRKLQRVIIFDWDDTLMCSSFLLRSPHELATSTVSIALLNALALEVKELLHLAKRLGSVYIITNAEEGWVQKSALTYMPAVFPALEGVNIVSARTRFEFQWPNLQGVWKKRAFLELRKHIDSTRPVDVIAIGDMPYEIAAAKALGRKLPNARVKTVKFRTEPTPCALLKEVRYVTKELERIVNLPDSVELVMR
mmetsp:Transcript_85088/g.244211  ORF Transcript_85088/g.244211 Transcript_85088/m.244211 type:complete len:282 (-) Transcript_85088:213-1058(-)